MKKIIFILIILAFIIPSITSARSGCCSHHGGVQSSGCGCNDGTPLSATCAPYYSCTATTYQPEPITTSPKNTIEPIPVLVTPKPPVINTIKTIPTTITPILKVTPNPVVKPTPEIKPIIEPIIEQTQKQNITPTVQTIEIEKPNIIKRFFNWLFQIKN